MNKCIHKTSYLVHNNEARTQTWTPDTTHTHQHCTPKRLSIRGVSATYIQYITYIADKTPTPISINPIIHFLYPTTVYITKQNYNKNPEIKIKLWSEKTNLDLESWDGNIITAIWSGFIERISWNSWISPHHKKLKIFSRRRNKNTNTRRNKEKKQWFTVTKNVF